MNNSEAIGRDIYKSRILVIEDEHFIRMLVIQALTSLGFSNVMEAQDGREALRIIEKNGFDIILSDIEMEPMNGLELVKQIRGGLTRLPRDIVVIFLTGLSDMSTLASISHLDVHGFLIKPISANMLRDKIEEAMRSRVELKPAEQYDALMFLPADVLDTETQSDNTLTVIKGRRGKIPPSFTVHTVANPNKAALEHDYAPPPKRRAPAKPATSILSIGSLQAGMVLYQDVYSRGILMMKKGSVLSSGHVRVLRDVQSVLDNDKIEVLAPEQ